MFYRLITNLQYSPGLIGQVTFYARRLQREEFVRRIGLIFSVLALALQGLLMFHPPQASLASSTNDIVFGGGSREKILSHYRNNRDDLGRTDLQQIYNRYSIYEENIAGMVEVTIQSRAENGFYSIGREVEFAEDIQIDIPGAAPVYSRPLHAWDRGAPYSTYSAFYGTTRTGEEFWILRDCGNIVMKKPMPNPLPPQLEIIKSITSPGSYIIKPGDEITYSIGYRNVGQGPAGFMKIEDLVPLYTSFVSATGPVKSTANGLIVWDHVDEVNNPFGMLGPTSWYHEVNLTVKVNTNVPNGQEICNIARISEATGSYVDTPPVCRKIEFEEEKPNPSAQCLGLTAEKLSRNEYKFVATASVTDGATINDFNFNFGDGSSQDSPNNNGTSEATHTFVEPGNYVIGAIVRTSLGHIVSNACSQQITVEPEDEPEEPVIIHNKEAKNLTQEIDDADNTVAKAGDRIEYKLITRNTGTVAAVDFELPAEDIADILEYADIEELNDAKFDEEKKKLTWDKATIEPGGKIEKVFIVKVKDPVPQTPVSASDATSFDLVMANKYGSDHVKIKLERSNNKRIEEVARSLPNTGITDNIISSTFLIGMSTYFYSRNRMISKELKLVKKEFTNG